MSNPNSERISANWHALTPVEQSKYIYLMSLAQMASEAYGLRPDMSENDMRKQLKQGNSVHDPAAPEGSDQRIGNQRMTDFQVNDFLANFDIVATSSETSAAGDYGMLLRFKEPDDGSPPLGTFVYSVRSTQPLTQNLNPTGNGGWEQDMANNTQMARYGVGISQLTRLNGFVQDTVPLLNGAPAVCAGGSLSGHQCLALTELHPEVFQAGDLPNYIQNATGAPTFNPGKTIKDYVATFEAVLNDPAAAENTDYARTLEPNTPAWDNFVAAWEAAARYQNDPNGGASFDSNAVWTTDANGNRVPQIDQSRPDVQFAAMIAQADTGASFALNPVLRQYDANYNHTIVTEAENQTGLNASVVSAMGVHPSLDNTYNIPIPTVPAISGNPIDSIVAATVDGHNSAGDIGASHAFCSVLDATQMHYVAQSIFPEMTNTQWSQLVRGATPFTTLGWVGTQNPQATEANLWTNVLGQISKQTDMPMSCNKCPTEPGGIDRPFDYNNRNAISGGASSLLESWNAAGKPTFRVIDVADAFTAPLPEGVSRATAAYFDLQAQLNAATPEERAALIRAMESGAPVAVVPNSPVSTLPSPTLADPDVNTDALIHNYVQTMRERFENWNTASPAINQETGANNPGAPNNDSPAFTDTPAQITFDSDAPRPAVEDYDWELAYLSTDGTAPAPPQAPPAPLYDPDSLFLGNLGADNPYVCRPDDPLLDLDSQAPAPVGTARPTPVATPGTAAVNSMANLILAIQNGNDLSAVLAGMSLVNNLDRVLDGAGNVIPTELSDTLGVVAGGLNLVNAIENGDAGGILVSGIGLINTLGNDAATKFISGTLGNFAGEMVPYLGVINSLAHGDPIGAVAGYLMTNPATFVFGAIIAVFGGMFADEPDIPVAVGNASAHWDGAGGVAIDTTYDEAGGGRTANAWLNNLVRGLQDELATRTDESGRPLYGLDPTRLPGIGYAFDADTGDGYLRLSWTDPDGTPQWRQYDTSGMRNDGQSVAGINDLARDFVFHASDAILPAWEADTRFQQGGDATAPAALFTGAVSADGASIARTVLSLGAGATATTTTASLDLDGDGYLESTQWTASPLLAVDLNGDGRVSAFELVDGRAGGDARNSLARLDANGDGVLDAGDPAFAALALWSDINGNGVVDAGEAGSLADAGIASLGYAGEAVTVGRTDGGGDTLNRTTLAGDTLGLARWLNEDGLYEAVEDGDTTLFAINQHDFDGDPDHVHGGLASPDARPASPPTPPRTSIPIAPFAFVPAAAATPARAVREVTREMIASADDGLFGAGHRGSATLGGPEVSRFQYNHKHIRRTTTTY